jgi:nickel transport protein
MKYYAICLAAFILLTCFSGTSNAHRVNVFAYVDGDAVQIECSFSKSQKVRNGKLTLTDMETGAILLEATTDEQGVFRFRPTSEFLQTGHSLNILLNAGEGHQNDWQISAEELKALTPADQTVSAQQTLLSSTEDTAALNSALTAAELEALIGRVVDAKLAPVRQALARQEDNGPELKDIIGGIGWILGLLGIAMYMSRR